MLDINNLQAQIRVCHNCDFNDATDVRYCGGLGSDHRIMFIAESPSTSGGTGIRSHEENFDCTGAERLFHQAREMVGLQECYITDLVKCGIPNGKPTIQKFEKCAIYLYQEIQLIKPKVIVAVGKSLSLQYDSRLVKHDFPDFLQQKIGNSIPITWVYHYSYVYRYKRKNDEFVKKYFKQFSEILDLI